MSLSRDCSRSRRSVCFLKADLGFLLGLGKLFKESEDFFEGGSHGIDGMGSRSILAIFSSKNWGQKT